MRTRWPNKPPLGVQINAGHSLATGLVGCWLLNEGSGGPLNLITRERGTLNSSDWAVRRHGPALIHNATGDRATLAADSRTVLPTTAITIVLRYFKKSILFASGAFGLDGSPADATRCGAHLPYSDGTTYWDFGGSSGNNRLSVAGLSFGDDTFAFSAGPAGQSIWQNGIRRAVNTTATPARTANSAAFVLGNHGNAGSDSGEYSFVYVWNRQLTGDEIRSVTAQPYQFMRGPERRFYPTAPAQSQAPRSMHQYRMRRVA